MVKIIIIENEIGQERGRASLNTSGKIFYLSGIHVLEEYQGRGWGTKLLNKINAYLDQKQMPAFLDRVMDDDDPAYDIYEKTGWMASKKGEDRFYYYPQIKR